MSRGRRRRGSGGQGGGQGGGGGGGGKARTSQRRSSRSRTRRRSEGAGFWGDPSSLPSPEPAVRMTDDATAVPRSLGEPPLPGHRAVAEHYFALVYDRAVTIAGAIAAAGGLIRPEALTEERGDDEG